MILGSMLASFLILQAADKVQPPPRPDFKKPVDYRAWMEKRVRGNAAEKDNGAPLFDKIFGDWANRKEGDAFPMGFCGPLTDPDAKTDPPAAPAPWDPKEHAKWESAFQKTAATRKDIATAAAKPYAFFGFRFGRVPAGEEPTLLGAFVPLALMRECAKGLLENSWRALDGKVDGAAALAAARTSFDLARHSDGQPGLIGHLVALSIRSLTCSNLIAALQHEVFTREQRADVVKLLDQKDQRLASLRRALYDEQAMFFDYLQVAVDENRGLPAFENVREVSEQIRAGKLDARSAPAAYSDAHEEILKIAAQPYKPDVAERIDAVVEQVTSKNPVAGVFLAAVGRVVVLDARGESLRRGTRLLYGIFVYHDKTGKWPKTLNDLPRDLLEAVATDPLGNQAFVYKLEGDAFTLYSVAQNGVDDGGKHDPKWGDKEQGKDFVFWPVPEP